MNVFEMSTPAWSIAARTALVFLAVFVGLRLMGEREIGQMTVFDLVLILLIANAVQKAMVGPDLSVQGGILASFVLLLVGTPTVLVEDGRFVQPHLRRERLGRDEVDMVIREHGLESVAAVKLAVLETDGSISIVSMTSRGGPDPQARPSDQEEMTGRAHGSRR
jgi:uncharacterized membrane protein YcaP (DUF421 family)